MSMRRTTIVVSVVAALLVLATPTRSATLDATPAAMSGPFAQFWGYITPVLVVEKGGELTYANFDIVKHDVVHDVEEDGFGTKKKMPWCKKEKDAHGHHHHDAACPVFWSAQIGLGDTTEVLGLENLKPGQIYTFFCTLHHGMKGTLIAR